MGITDNYEFYDASHITKMPLLNSDKNLLMNFEITNETVQIQHSRRDYNIVDLLGDIGGIQYIFVVLFSWLLMAFSKFNMIMDSFNTLFKLNEHHQKLIFN
jgi:hypothetical protein